MMRNDFTIPTAHKPAEVSRHSWYIGSVDDGIFAGPFRTREKALIWLGAETCKKEMWAGRFSGSYIPMVGEEQIISTSIARGGFFASQRYAGVTLK